MLKRSFDWFLSSFGLLTLSPIFLVLIVLIKLNSPGPAFFRQERVGRHGRLFRIHKFRTMVADAERQGLQITVGDDLRITSVGKWLRKYKIDELPQLLDVWSGNMSIVGPRPEVPNYVACYPEDIRNIVLSVRPGITDKASIEFRNENEIMSHSLDPNNTYISEILPVKLNYYVEYVNNQSLIGDIFLILRTFKAILR